MLDDSSPLDRLYLNSQFKLDPFWRVGCHRMPDVFIEVEHPPMRRITNDHNRGLAVYLRKHLTINILSHLHYPLVISSHAIHK